MSRRWICAAIVAHLQSGPYGLLVINNKTNEWRIGSHLLRTPKQRRHTPASEKYAYYHQQRDDYGRDSDLHELGRCLGCSEPRSRTETGKDSHQLQCTQSRGLGSRFNPNLSAGGQLIQRSTTSPAASTATGIQN